MFQDDGNVKKHLYVKRTPKIIIEKLINDVLHSKDNAELPSDIINRLHQLETSSIKYNVIELVHMTKTLQTMVKRQGTKVVLPKYMERAFLLLLEEMLMSIQNPTQIQQRLPKVRDENVLYSVREYNIGVERTVILVDNDILFLNKTASLLTEAGFKVLKSNRGKQALKLITESQPDCIIFGLNLIDINIEAFLKDLHERVNTLFVPIVVIGHENEKDLIDKIKFNINDSILKPLVIDDLFVKMMRLLDHVSRMKKQVHIDELTGVYSRKFIMEKLEYYYCNDKEKEYPHALAILDLDYFKDVNDKYGHQIGDKVLVEFAQFINSKIRSTDIFARYGGEEFILLLPRTKTIHALKKINALQKEFKEKSIDIGDDSIKQTFSGGIVSNKDVRTDHPVEVLNLADIALYAAKNSGRNRVLIYDPMMRLKKEQYKILIVDDDRFTRNILLDGLKDKQWSLFEATNGLEAIEIAKEQIPNIILLDGLMPEMNGYETLEEIRKNIRFKQTAVIMLTGNHSEENIARALEAGADDYITKPFSLVELKARINRSLVRH